MSEIPPSSLARSRSDSSMQDNLKNLFAAGASDDESDSEDDDVKAKIRAEKARVAKAVAAKESEEKRQRVRRARRIVLKDGGGDIHAITAPSILDTASGPQNYRGFMNLVKIVFLATNIRLLFENLLKYGILLKGPSLKSFDPFRTLPCLGMILSLPCFAYLANVIERRAWAQSTASANRLANWLHFFNINICFFSAILVIHITHSNMLSGLVLLFLNIVTTMKLISYAHVMSCDRERKLSIGVGKKTDDAADGDGDKKSGKKPTTGKSGGFEFNPDKDLPPLSDVDTSFSQLLYCLAAPTLCYQHKYPRTSHVRKEFIWKRLLELLICLGLMIIFSQQYVEPTLKNALKYMNGDRWHWGGLTERVLKLSIPNLVVWLLMFYSTFHAFLNITAELLCFGDRVFYRDWWNANTLKDYWNRWNIPVHNWVLRHIYAPCIRNGFTNLQAQAIVFFVSAVLHEVLVSVPAHVMRFHAFFGMLFQVPLILITNVMLRYTSPTSQWGNVLFWLSFCVFGQPLIIIFYYAEFIALGVE